MLSLYPTVSSNMLVFRTRITDLMKGVFLLTFIFIALKHSDTLISDGIRKETFDIYLH